MKTNYKTTFYSMIGIILIILITALTGCKKDEKENPQPTPPPVVVTPTTYDTYTLVSYNGEDSVNVNKTIYRISNDEIKFTTPLTYWYGVDTMKLKDKSMTNQITKYNFDHQFKKDMAYKVVGNLYLDATFEYIAGFIYSPGYIYMHFKKVLVATPFTTIGVYKLTYKKI